jgi:hypothetical protein
MRGRRVEHRRRGIRIGLTATVTGGILTAAAARRGAATVSLRTRH